MSKGTPRRRMREFPAVIPRLQYLILPYVNFQIGQLGKGTEFTIGPFTVWKDLDENWRKFLKISRPAKHLSMYVNRAGAPAESIWISTSNTSERITPEKWQQITSALFYLAWARIPYMVMLRPAAEDFYAEPFVLPQGANEDSTSHVRWSKYGNTFWSEIKIHPAPDVSSIGTQIDLPITQGRESYPFFDPTTSELFEGLANELSQRESRILTALWFLMEASYRSPSRSSYAEDIQNLCTAFEALLDVNEKGNSNEQVANKLAAVFEAQRAGVADDLSSREPAPERPEVLQRLRAWVVALYDIRNAYTHGRVVRNEDYEFHDRSIWQDSFELFRLTANRTILERPEARGDGASLLEKRLMSVSYFDDVVDEFSDKEWIQVASEPKPKAWSKISKLRLKLIQFILRRGEDERRDVLAEAIRKGRALDPELVESITGLKKVRQALYNICSAFYVTLQQTDFRARSDASKLRAFVARCDEAFRESRRASGTFDTDAYIRKVGPSVLDLVVGIRILGRDTELYELVSPFRALLRVYQNFTTPILKSDRDSVDDLFSRE